MQFRKSGSGSLTIVASWLTGTYLLPELIAEFGHLHPAVHISLELGTAAQAVERLRSHRAELGFIAGAVGGPEIEVERLLEYEVVIVGQPGLVPDPPSREELEVLTGFHGKKARPRAALPTRPWRVLASCHGSDLSCRHTRQ